LDIFGIDFYSPKHIFDSCMLAQHGQFANETTFWENNEAVLTDPSIFNDKVEKWFEDRYIEEKACWVLNQEKAWARVVVTLLEHRNNAFAWKLRDLYNEYGVYVRFAETTHNPNERVWASGYRSEHLPEDPALYCGANLYGRILEQVFVGYFTNDDTLANIGMPELSDLLFSRVLSNRQYSSYKKTIAIISDSIAGFASYVQGGDIWYQPGATVGQLATLIREKHGALIQFKFVVIFATTNDAMNLHSPEEYEESWGRMRSLLEPLKHHPHTVVIFHTGIGAPRWEYVPGYTQWFIDAFTQDFGSAGNFRLYDWSIPHERNLLLKPDGNVQDGLFESDERHPNRQGLRMMWKMMAEENRERENMQLVRLGIANTKYAAGKLKDRVTLI
jgi:hypothetical protein